jgi:hypothetical protein
LLAYSYVFIPWLSFIVGGSTHTLMTDDESRYQQQLEERIRHFEASARNRRYVAVMIGAVTLLIIWAKMSAPKCVWVPNYKKQEVVFIRKKLFHQAYVVRCTWQLNEYGQYGWCAKDSKGKWFIFACDEIWQAMHDYPHVLTGAENFPHETNAKINE